MSVVFVAAEVLLYIATKEVHNSGFLANGMWGGCAHQVCTVDLRQSVLTLSLVGSRDVLGMSSVCTQFVLRTSLVCPSRVLSLSTVCTQLVLSNSLFCPHLVLSLSPQFFFSVCPSTSLVCPRLVLSLSSVCTQFGLSTF